MQIGQLKVRDDVMDMFRYGRYLNGKQLKVLIALRSLPHPDRKTQRIAFMTNLTTRTVKKVESELIEIGLLNGADMSINPNWRKDQYKAEFEAVFGAGAEQ